MAQIEFNLPLPVGNGVGTPVDVSTMGLLKTIVCGGGATCVITVEMSNDVVAQNFAPVAVFNQSGQQVVFGAYRWMRATVREFLRGTPQVDVGGTNDGSTFVQLVAPPDDGVGAAVDVSAMGLYKTAYIGGDFRGAMNLEISEDGVSWATLFSFNNPGQQTTIVAAQWMRVRRNGVPEIVPGLPTVYIGAADPVTGPGGLGAISAGSQLASSGTLAFANSNGVSFGMSASSQITASMDAFRSIIALGSTATGPTLSFVNTNGVTFGMSGGSLTASVQTVGGTATGVGISAGTQLATTGAVVFSNSNGISYGLSNQTLTASFQAIKTVSAGTTAITGGNVSFADSNGVSFGVNGQTVTASAFRPAVERVVGFTATGGETVATVTFAPALASTNYSVFAQQNGVSFGLNVDLPAGSANRSVSAFKFLPSAAMASSDALAFFLFQSS